MDATTEIDKAGRLVVPKKLRESLHLTPGTRVILRKQGDLLTIEPEQPEGKLVEKRGFLVWECGAPGNIDVVKEIQRGRAERAQAVVGDWIELDLP